jgi:hypothetical protein
MNKEAALNDRPTVTAADLPEQVKKSGRISSLIFIVADDRPQDKRRGRKPSRCISVYSFAGMGKGRNKNSILRQSKGSNHHERTRAELDARYLTELLRLRAQAEQQFRPAIVKTITSLIKRKKISVSVKSVLEIIGFVASVLGIISFYLDHLR